MSADRPDVADRIVGWATEDSIDWDLLIASDGGWGIAETLSTNESPYSDGRVLVVDSSAWAVIRKAHRRQPLDPLIGDFTTALRNGQLRGSDVVKLELLHSARNSQEFFRVELELDEIRTLSVTRTASRAAVGALRDLAATSTPGDPMRHRVSGADALIAATAWDFGCGVLHYDGHFDRLAQALNIQSFWISAPGSF